MKNITLGLHYNKLLVEKSTGPSITRHNIEKTDYGYKIIKITHYITISRTKLIINKNGSAKSVTRVEKNYCAPYQFTLYFDCQGKEIKGKSTRAEGNYYRSLQ